MSRFLTTAGERIADLAELAAEAGRLSRGRALFRKGSVSDLSIGEGTVIASVRGSQGDLYETSISTTLAPPGVTRQVANQPEDRRGVDDLIDDGIEVCPREIDLAFDCDCGDWDEPCKHVVAVFLAFADRVDIDEAQLLRWRGVDASTGTSAGTSAGAGAEPAPGPRSRKAEPDTPARAAVEPRTSSRLRSTGEREPAEAEEEDDAGDRSARLSELESLLGDTVMRVPTTDDPETEPASSTLEASLAEFLGVGAEIEPVDVSEIPAIAPLFASVELGPLADLGPELATALAIIAAGLEDPSTPTPDNKP